jgi:hypothetical protein
MKHFKRIGFGFLIVILILFVALNMYAETSYESLEAMDTAIGELALTNVEIAETNTTIMYTVANPIMNIIFVPGGLVEADSYTYLAAQLALNGYNVTISKAKFNLAIFQPNKPNRYIDKDLENVIIGHSLGGVVSTMAASGNDDIDKVILMGSYAIKDITDKDTLIISAEHDIAMDEERFNDALQYVNSDVTLFTIEGGNHAQFGWYGPQKGDGTAEISTITQQNIIVTQILDFLSQD